MHGIIFNQFFKYLRKVHGAAHLKATIEQSDRGKQFYDATQHHPDEDLESLIYSSCTLLKVSREHLLEAFGQFITPGLFTVYGSFIKQEWNMMDLLEQVENTIHKSVRLSNPEAAPPALQINRTSAHHLTITYTSQRNMLAFGIGIIKAISKHYQTDINIVQVDLNDKKMLEISAHSLSKPTD